MNNTLAPIIITLIILIPLPTVSLAQTDNGSVDCQFLLIMADNILRQSLTEPQKALGEAKTLYNISLPEDLKTIHTQFYNTLLELIYTVHHRGEGDPLRELRNLTNIYTLLPKTYRQYSERLASCSVDPQVASTLRVSGGLVVSKSILPMLEQRIAMILSNESASSGVSIILSKTNYSPNEKINVIVDLSGVNIMDPVLAIVEWPTLTPVQYLKATRHGNNLKAVFNAPIAVKLKTLPLYGYLGGRNQLSLAVIFSGTLASTGEKTLAYKVFNVIYRVPQLEIKSPETIEPGQNISFTIVSDGTYPNTTIKANNIEIFNTTLYPGPNNYTFNPRDYGLEGHGVIVLNVEIPPGDDYLGTERSKPIIVSTHPQGVNVYSPQVIVTWTGLVTAEIEVKGGEETIVIAGLGPIKLAEKELYTGNNTLNFYASLLPITPLKLRVIEENTRSSRSLTREILVVNPAYTILTTALILLLVAYRSGREVFLWIPVRVPKAGTRTSPSLLGSRDRVYRRIRSRIAELYYGVLLRLKQSLPSPTETLREHYKRLELPDRVKGSLWRLLRLVEEDLYSKRKPLLDDALRVLKKVLRNE